MLSKANLIRTVAGFTCGAFLVFAGCDDKGVTRITTYPTVTIQTPSDGDELVEDVLVLMKGLVVDDSFADELETLIPVWSVDGEQVCTDSTIDVNGETLCSHSFDAKESVTITLKVTNPTGGASTYDVVVSVIENNIPTVLLVKPVDTRVYYSDRKVEFEAQVSDIEDDPEDLVVSWTSDIDGALTELDKPPTSAGVHAGAVQLSKGEHRIEVLVEDTGGKTISDAVSITVGDPNTPPNCAIDTPLDGAVLAFTDTVEFKGLGTDNEIPSSDLTATWSSSIDGVLYTGKPNSSGETRFNYSALSQNNHIITLSVEDDVGARCEDTISVKVGSKPTLTLIEPGVGDVFNEGETVFFRASVYDVETAFTDLGLTWDSTLDGRFSTQGADSSGIVSFSETTLSGGDHTITVTVTDEDGLSAVETVNITVNRLPTQPVIELVPNPTTSSDALTVNLATPSTDADGHAILYGYAWIQNGTTTSYISASLPAAATARGDVWRVEVTPRDLYGSGPMAYDSITIGNSKPILSSVSLTPNPATVEDTLTCTPGSVTDVDGDTVTYRYSWTVGGASVSASTNTLSSTFFSRSDVVVCSVTPNDGIDDGLAVSSTSVTIANTPPTLSKATLTPVSPVESSTLICTAGTTADADGDTVTLGYEWVVNGSTVSATTSTLNGTYFSVTDDVYCTITPNDGSVDGAPVSSNTVVIENTPPEVASAGLTPTTATETTTFTCAGGATSDDDGDTVTLSYAWELNGAPISATGSTLTGADFDKKDKVACVITPNDGTENGTAIRSNVVEVDNTLPVLSSVSLTPDPAYELDVLTCTPGSVTDADGDTINFSYEWMVDSTVLTVGGNTLSGTYFDRGDVVICMVTPNDGDGDGATVDSSAVTIENSIPSLLSVSLTPTTAYEDSTLTCTPGTASDDDGDTIVYIYEWTVGSTTLSVGTSTLTGSYFDKGDAVQCSVQPRDSFDRGSKVLSNAVTVSNSLPVVASASLSPTTANENSILNCLSGTTSDKDGDGVTLTYRWQVNGATIGYTGTSIDGTHFDRDDKVNCRLVPNDGTDDGTPVNSNIVTIQNSSPTINSIVVAPSIPFTDDSLTVSISGVNDEDGDSVTYQYQWYVNGVAVSSGGTGAALANSKTEKDDSVYVVVTPNDGTTSGTPLTSSFVTILNTPPEVPVIDLTPDDAEPDDNLSCDVDVDSYDEDGDSIFYTYKWAKNGMLTSYTTRTLSYVNTADGDTWTCYATPNDGDDDGAPGFDSVVVADRTAPDRPIISSIERYRNSTTVELNGTAEAFASVVVYVSCSDGSTTSYTTTASSSGTWSVTATQAAGKDCDYYARATDTSGNVSPDSNTVETEICDPGDGYEYLDQELCTDPVSEWATLDSDGTVTISIEGNIVDGNDRDWYHIDTSQTFTSGPSGSKINPYDLEIALSDGSADYDFFVYRGGCASSDVECSTSGYDTYDYYAYDDGSANHSPPSNRAACKTGSNSFNDCADFSDDVYIKVVRTSAFNCKGYTLDITNGK